MTTTTSPATQQRIPERTNTAAMIGLFCALIGLGLIALVVGCTGVFEIERSPHETGTWIGIVAAALGLIEVIAAVVFAVITFSDMSY
ncbi:hypothetical protein M2284_002646 [Rhodococcus sp. LBL1]|nr:hypothetical protein [Rhodococcus sp. LBL1]MDH6684030.1 hypothetical protein [Rhodococcus sp. LBL2]